jgi:hypothetical protein
MDDQVGDELGAQVVALLGLDVEPRADLEIIFDPPKREVLFL